MTAGPSLSVDSRHLGDTLTAHFDYGQTKLPVLVAFCRISISCDANKQDTRPEHALRELPAHPAECGAVTTPEESNQVSASWEQMTSHPTTSFRTLTIGPKLAILPTGA